MLNNESNNRPGWLFVVPWSLGELGGVNRVILELCNAMNRDGVYRPYVMVLDWDAYDPIITEYPGYTEIKYKLRGIKYGGTNSLRNNLILLITLPNILLKLRRLILDKSIKVINFHYPTCAIFSLVVYRKIFSGSKLIISLHGSDIIGIGKEKYINKIFWNKMMATADAVVSCSSGLKKYFESIFQDLPKPSIAIPNGLPEHFRNPENVRGDHIGNVLSGKKYILCVGAFLKVKGQDILLDAFNAIQDKNTDIDLVLIGREGELLEECNEKIHRYRINSRVHVFPGIDHDKLRLFYENALMYVSPSRHESFPLCLLEAGACSIPVIASNTIGASELIKKGYDGIIVPVGDSQSLAKAMMIYLNDGIKREVYSKRLNKKVFDTYTWDKALRRYKEIIVE